MIVIARKSGPQNLRERPCQFIQNMIDNEPIGIWIRSYLNPMIEVRSLLLEAIVGRS